MKNISIVRLLVFPAATIMALVICAVALLQLWVIRESNYVHTEVRSSVQSVLRAYLLGKLTGSYWENEMLAQNKVIARLPVNRRVEFFKEIIIHCDLDTSRATLFIEMVGSDIEALKRELDRFKTDHRYSELLIEQKRHIDDWDEEVSAIYNDMRNKQGPHP